MLESVVQSRVREMLMARGIDSEKIWGNAINFGFPDLFCGSFWIECKAPKKKLRKDQVEWFETWVDRHGARAYVVDDPRQLWSIISKEGTCTGKPGTMPSNWKSFVAKPRRGKVDLAQALKAFATRS